LEDVFNQSHILVDIQLIATGYTIMKA